METLHIIPSWFLGLNIFFDMIFVIFTALIATYSFKIYKISDQRESKNFGLAFGFLSISYLLLIILNTLFLSAIQGNLRVLDFDDLLGIKNTLVMFYSLTFLLGFITLFYTTTKSKSPRLYIGLLILSVLALGFSSDRSLILYFIASIFLALITIYYFNEYASNKNKNTLRMGASMFLLLASNILMALTGRYFMPNAFVVSRFLEIGAYSFIIYNLVEILNNGKKKK